MLKLLTYVFNQQLATILLDVYLLILIIFCFCCTLYLVTEIQVPDNTFDYCTRLCQIYRLEWAFNLALGISFIFLGYFVCGFMVFPIGVWHLFRHVQRGDPFGPTEIHKKKTRDAHIRFYGVKLILYALMFLTLMIYIGFGITDFVLTNKWHESLQSLVLRPH